MGDGMKKSKKMALITLVITLAIAVGGVSVYADFGLLLIFLLLSF